MASIDIDGQKDIPHPLHVVRIVCPRSRVSCVRVDTGTRGLLVAGGGFRVSRRRRKAAAAKDCGTSGCSDDANVAAD